MIKEAEILYRNLHMWDDDYVDHLWKTNKKRLRKYYFIRKRRAIWSKYSRNRVYKNYLIDKHIWYVAKTNAILLKGNLKYIKETHIEKNKCIQSVV